MFFVNNIKDKIFKFLKSLVDKNYNLNEIKNVSKKINKKKF